MYRQAKASRRYKHGWEVPKDYAHALQLDVQNCNNKWRDAIDLEIEQIKEYQESQIEVSRMFVSATDNFTSKFGISSHLNLKKLTSHDHVHDQ